MRVGTYTFKCRFTSQAFLPQFKGSTIRGAFGNALKRISCALRHQTCDSCLLFETCAYAFLFEVKKALPFESRSLRVAHRPHPYVLVPPDNPQRAYEAGASFSFEFILFGRANDYLPHILYAIREAGKNGLGKKTDNKGRFNIEHILLGDKTIFTGDSLDTGQPLQQLSLESDAVSNDTTITLSCLTPLRLKYINELRDSLPFHLIIRAALRRISTLEAIYGDGEPDIDYKGIAARASEMQITSSDCRWIEVKRYSSRQQNTMIFGGVKGHTEYTGKNISEFLPLLKYCVATHLGKQTSFGLGRIAIHNSLA